MGTLMDFDDLPPNVVNSILLCLEYKQILRMASVSKSWLGFLSKNQAFWRRRLELDFGEWEGAEVNFEERYKIEYGWRFAEPTVVELEGHNGFVNDVKLYGSKMVSCASDKSVLVWDLESMECLCEFKEKDGVDSIALDGGRVFVGLNNGEVHVWSLESREMCHSWEADESMICTLSLVNGLLISGGWCSLRIWDASTFECLQDFEVEGFKRLHPSGDELICGLFNRREVSVLHKEDGLLYTLDVGKVVCSVSANLRHIFVGCNSGSIQVWDKATKERVAVLDGGGPFINTVWCDGGKLISVASNGCMKIWHSKQFSQIRQIELGKEHVRWADCEESKIVVGLSWGPLRVLDFSL